MTEIPFKTILLPTCDKVSVLEGVNPKPLMSKSGVKSGDPEIVPKVNKTILPPSAKPVERVRFHSLESVNCPTTFT